MGQIPTKGTHEIKYQHRDSRGASHKDNFHTNFENDNDVFYGNEANPCPWPSDTSPHSCTSPKSGSPWNATGKKHTSRVQRNTLHTFPQSDAMMHSLAIHTPIRIGVENFSPTAYDETHYSSSSTSHSPSNAEPLRRSTAEANGTSDPLRGGTEEGREVSLMQPQPLEKVQEAALHTHVSPKGGAFHQSSLTAADLAGLSSRTSAPPSQTRLTVRFYPTIIQYKDDGVKKWLASQVPVYVAVECMNWKQLPMTRSTESFFAVVPLPPGAHNCRFFIGNNEVVDHTQPLAPVRLPRISSHITSPSSSYSSSTTSSGFPLVSAGNRHHKKERSNSTYHSNSITSNNSNGVRSTRRPTNPSNGPQETVGCTPLSAGVTTTAAGKEATPHRADEGLVVPVKPPPLPDNASDRLVAMVPKAPMDGRPANYLILDDSFLQLSEENYTSNRNNNRNSNDNNNNNNNSNNSNKKRASMSAASESPVHADHLDGDAPKVKKGEKVEEKEEASDDGWGQEEVLFKNTQKFPPLLPLHLRYTPLNTTPTPFRCSSDGTMLVLDPSSSTACRPAPEQLPCPLSVTIQHVYFQRREDHVVLGMTTRYENKCATIVYYTTATNVVPTH